MPPTARERQLARQRAARRAAREAEQAQKRRRNLSIAGSVLVVLLLVGGIWALVGLTGNDKKTPAAAPSGDPAAASAAAAGPCGYTNSSQSAGKPAKPASLPPAEPQRTGAYTAKLDTSQGAVTFDLLTDKAPCAVGSFRSLAGSGFYDNTPCHRLVAQPMFGVLQCGDPSGTGSGGPGYTFNDENLTGATYPKGTVAMANSGPNTNGSQFFLVFTDTQLSPNYTPFGRITSGLDVLEKVAKGGVSGTGGDGAPKIPVQLNKVTVAAS
ncbi:MAG: peptidyl-prolyl cis-trans isomerase [Frankiaceae bacterium]|nr:peptidyl-prolyl cis-trans isomerase [Frankiaceae bacterium]MDQ1649117.1 peptidyl-prolyl cis-trans isomerase [Frankiaceae bacterium]